MISFSEKAMEFVNGVQDGSIPSCQDIIMAVARSLQDFETYNTDDSLYVFDAKEANRAVDYIESMPTIEDSPSKMAGEHLELMHFQRWFVEQLFGWVRRDNPKMRRFVRAIYFVARGNGKSALASAIISYLAFMCGVGGVEAVCAASNKEQAFIVIDTTRKMLQTKKRLCAQLQLEIRAHEILMPLNNSHIWAMPSRATSVEGRKLYCAVLDEVHAARGRQLYDVLKGGCAKRDGSLFLLISTAAEDTDGIAWDLVEGGRKILHAQSESTDDGSEVLLAMFGIDDGDDWREETSIRKANPGWGVTVLPDRIRKELADAVRMPGEAANFRRIHCNDWLAGNGADVDFFDRADLQKCLDTNLQEHEFVRGICVSGLDCGSVQDFMSLYFVYMRKIDGKEHYYAFGRNWLNKKAIHDSPVAMYRALWDSGEVIMAGEKVTSFEAVERFILDELITKLKVRSIAFDTTQARYLEERVKKQTGKDDLMIQMPQIAKSLTPGIKMLQGAIAEERFHTNSRALIWALQNIRCKPYNMNWLQPIRPERREKKIDPAAAVIMAMSSAFLVPLDETKPEGSGIFFI